MVPYSEPPAPVERGSIYRNVNGDSETEKYTSNCSIPVKLAPWTLIRKGEMGRVAPSSGSMIQTWLGGKEGRSVGLQPAASKIRAPMKIKDILHVMVLLLARKLFINPSKSLAQLWISPPPAADGLHFPYGQMLH